MPVQTIGEKVMQSYAVKSLNIWNKTKDGTSLFLGKNEIIEHRKISIKRMTKTVEIQGFVTTGEHVGVSAVTVRYTADSIGKTLSLAIDDLIQITVPFELIEKITEERV